MEYYIIQIVTFLFAFPFSVYEENAFTFPFREFPWPSGYDKTPYIRKAHRFGAGGVFIVLLGLSTVACMHLSPWWLHGIIFLATTGLIYWQTFDSGYGISVNRGIFYLGDTASTDSWWVKRFGSMGGKVKFFLFITLVVILNVLYLIIKNRYAHN